MIARLATGLVVAALASCASAPRSSSDDVARAERTVAGFREAGAATAELLDAAAAWAVFHGVEERGDTWSTAGTLFAPGAPPRAVLLHASAGATSSPARRCYHCLVVLTDPKDLDAIECGALDLAQAQELALVFDRADRAPDARTFVVTSARAGLLFPPPSVQRVLELAPEDSLRD